MAQGPLCGLRLATGVILLISCRRLAADAPSPADVAAGAQAAAGNGDKAEAFKFCIAYLENTPESTWDPNLFRAILDEVKRQIDHSFDAMSRDEQKAALASIDPAPSTAAGKLAFGYANWLAGNRGHRTRTPGPAPPAIARPANSGRPIRAILRFCTSTIPCPAPSLSTT
jgi:hypothetical protein